MLSSFECLNDSFFSNVALNILDKYVFFSDYKKKNVYSYYIYASQIYCKYKMAIVLLIYVKGD